MLMFRYRMFCTFHSISGAELPCIPNHYCYALAIETGTKGRLVANETLIRVSQLASIGGCLPLLLAKFLPFDGPPDHEHQNSGCNEEEHAVQEHVELVQVLYAHQVQNLRAHTEGKIMRHFERSRQILHAFRLCQTKILSQDPAPSDIFDKPKSRLEAQSTIWHP